MPTRGVHSKIQKYFRVLKRFEKVFPVEEEQDFWYGMDSMTMETPSDYVANAVRTYRLTLKSIDPAIAESLMPYDGCTDIQNQLIKLGGMKNWRKMTDHQFITCGMNLHILYWLCTRETHRYSSSLLHTPRRQS